MFRSLRSIVLTAMALALAACGGGESPSSMVQPTGCSDCGTAVLSLTDAPGDFLSYTVDITSIQLTKANGAKVETLPAATRVDLVQLVDMSEVIAVGQIPAGAYTSVTLNVDYGNAEIIVEGAGGNGVTVQPVGAGGQPAGAMALTLQLDPNRHFVVSRGRLAHLAFDFDLLASNTVDLPGAKVTVNPFVVASLSPPPSRDMRARGALAAVDTTASTYTIDLRPFHRGRHADARQLTVHVDGNTAYEINGVVYAGAAGLAQMASLTDSPLTVAFGSWQGNGAGYLAKRVLVGTSLPGADRDFVSGNVLSRSGNVLQLGSVREDRRDGHFGYVTRVVEVTVADATVVTKAGQVSGIFGIGDISVGQRIEVLGQLDRTDPMHLKLDATAGRVRLAFTHLFGQIVAAANTGVTLDLVSIDGRRPEVFNFAGTGASTADDADPTHYDVATTLNMSSMPLQAYTRLIGFVSPFGTAPPDFNAITFIDYEDVRAVLGLGWGLNGATAPFLSINASAITIDTANTSLVRGGVAFGGTALGLASLGGLSIVPPASGTTTYAIGHRASHSVTTYASFAEFSAALGTALNGTTAILNLEATGQFNAGNKQFTAARLLVVLND